MEDNVLYRVSTYAGWPPESETSTMLAQLMQARLLSMLRRAFRDICSDFESDPTLVSFSALSPQHERRLFEIESEPHFAK